MAYYDLAFLDRALDLLRQNQSVLMKFIQVTESRYVVGTGAQHDVFEARVDAARLAEEAVALTEERRATLAQLNGLLDRSSDSSVEGPRVPERIARSSGDIAVGDSFYLGCAWRARSGLSAPAARGIAGRAIRSNPTLRAHEAEIAAHAARVELARKAHLPDLDLSLQYGQRAGISAASQKVRSSCSLFRSRWSAACGSCGCSATT